MTRSRRFPNRPDSVPAARYFTRDALDDAPSRVLSAVELMVSELVTNCVRHTHTSFELSISQNRREIRVEVSDKGAGQPSMGSPQPTDMSGRGLPLVDMMSEDWGVENRPGGVGKTVWFTVASGDGADSALACGAGAA